MEKGKPPNRSETVNTNFSAFMPVRHPQAIAIKNAP
jgi:hypothetical protein